MIFIIVIFIRNFCDIFMRVIGFILLRVREKEIRKVSFFLQQFIVRSTLRDEAILQDNDVIDLWQVGNIMSNEDSCLERW